MRFLLSVLIEYHRNDFIDIIREYISVPFSLSGSDSKCFGWFFPCYVLTYHR